MKKNIALVAFVIAVLTAATPALALTLNRWIGTTADWHTASNWETGVPTSDSQILFGFSPYQTFPNDPDIGATDAECGKLEMAGDYYSPITFSGTATLTNYADLGSYQDDMTVNCPLNMQSGAPRLLANAGTTLAIMNGLTLTGASAVVAGTNQKVNDPAGTVKLAAACSGTADWYVYGGTLLVTNPSGSATGSGTIFLYHGDTLYATLAGTGCVGTGAHNLDNYGTIDPGDGAIGILTANVGAAQFYDSSVLNIRASGAEISKLVVSGNLVLNQGTDDSTLTVDGTMTAAGTCITYGGTLTGTFANTDLPTDYWVDYSVPGQVSVVPPGVPSAPSSLTATAISNSRIDLVWTDNSDNETGFKIERKTGAEGTWGQIDTVGEGVTTYQNTGLDPETEYYYRVRAYNAAGDSVPSPEANATTLVAAVPAAPSNLIALAASSTQINLEWTDNSNNEHGFKIERKTGEQGEWGQIDTVGVNVTTYSDTDLDPSTLYYYRVRAYNDVGDSDYSNEAYATTQTPGIPAAPSDLTATAVSSGQIDLEWTDNSDNEIGFKIDRKTGAEGTWGPLDTVGEDVTTYEDTGLPASTTFYYRVRAYNAVGDSDYSFEAYDTTWAPTYNFWRGTTADWHDADNWVDYIPDSDRDALMNIGHPASPFNPDINYDPDIGATDATCQTLDIAGDPYEWTLSGTGTLSVYGNIGASVAGTQTIDCPLYIRDGYYPRVFAASGTTLVITQGLNTSGPVQGIVTTVETVGTPGGILKIPAASTNPAFYDVRGGTLMATNTTGSATGSNYVQLYDGGTLAGNGIVGDGGNNVRNSGTINPGSGNFGDIATLTCNVTGVTFYDGSALHLQSDGTNISKLAITGTGDLDLNYNNTIEIEGAITNNGVCITYTGTRTGEFTNLLPVGYFSVDYGTAGQVKIVSLVPPGAPTAPSNLTATTVSYDKIDLAWTDNSDNEDGFKIERKTTGAWAQIDTVGEGVTTYNDTGLDPETTYYYRVRAYNAAGDSVYTNKASATTDAVPTIPITINAPYGISYSLAPIDIIFSTTTGAYQIYDINKTLVAEGTTTSNPQTINFTPPNYSWYLIVFAGEAKFMGVTPAFANMNTLDWGEMDDTRGNNNEPLQAFCGLMLDRTNTERTFAQAHAIMDLADLYGVTLLTQFTNVGDITTENVTAWVTEMQGKVKYWEIINEPNLFISVNDYVTLLQLAYSIIKDIDPAAIVMGPDTCSVDLPWNEAFMEAGGGNYIDAYSIHDYEGNGIDPFHWIWKMNSVRALMDTYGIGTMPIWQTERAIDAVHGLVFLGANQAIHITLHRDLLELFGVTNNHNYHFYTDDHGFHAVPTFVFASSGPHPAALVVRTRCAMTQALDRTFVEKLDFGATGNKMFLGLLYTGADGSTLTLRNLGMDELPVDLDISSGASVDVVDSFGNVETVPIQSGKATITTTQLPIYVKLTTSQSVTAPTIDLGTNIASEATFTYSGGNTSDPALLTDGIMQVWHANNPWGDPWKGDYLGEYFDETPETFDITFPTAREITGLLVYGARADNPYSAILDYDLQYHDGQDWVTLEEVRAACPTSTIIPTFLCNAVAWLMDNNFYVHQFAEPVTTDKLRLIVRRVTIGYMPDIEASQAAGWNPSGHWLLLREIEVYEGAPAAPNAPSDLTATAVSDSQIDLEWTDNSDNETGFKIERKTGVAGEWGQIDTVGEDVTTYNDMDLDPATTYYYRVRAYNAVGDSAYSNEANATTEMPEGAGGLLGDYYDNMDFTNLKVTRIDPTIDFDWGNGSPDPSIGVDTFSVRWTGHVKPLYSETYTFYTTTDDGVRLWVDNTLIVDKWVDQGPTEWSGTISLTAGTKYDIKMEYYENTGDAAAQLRWSSASQAKEIIPASQLYPTAEAPNAPSDLTATTVSSSQIDLEWTDNSNNEDGFAIERKTGEQGTWAQIDLVGADVTTYNDTDLDPETEYYYRVLAYNTIGDSDYSNEANATTEAEGGGEHIYNFVGIEASDPDYNAYACDVDVFTFAGSSNNRNSQLEATDQQYVNISADNTAQWETLDPGRNDEVFLWVEMKITEAVGDITQIDLTFNGNTDGTAATTHKIYVLKAGADWTEDASWVQVGTSLDIEPDVDTEMTRSITTSISDYIDGSGNITWGVYETRSSENLRINYLEMKVTSAP